MSIGQGKPQSKISDNVDQDAISTVQVKIIGNVQPYFVDNWSQIHTEVARLTVKRERECHVSIWVLYVQRPIIIRSQVKKKAGYPAFMIKVQTASS